MIKDSLKNSKTYYSLSENLKIGLKWLEEVDIKKLNDGRYEINDSVYASVQTYITKDNAMYEAHRKYIDIQYVISGCEKVGVTELSNCRTSVEYDSEKDLEFYDIDVEEEYVDLNEGQFLILFPHDAHKPSVKRKVNSEVKKVVVKVSV